MKTSLISLAICGLIGTVFLAGCKAQETPVSTPGMAVTQSNPTLTFTASMPATSQLETAYPGPSGLAETVYPPPAGPTQAVYPAPTEEFLAYPAPSGQTQPAFPVLTEPAQAAYPNPTQPVAAYPGPTQPVAAYPNPTQPAVAYPGLTQSVDLAGTAQSTTTAPVVPLVTAAGAGTPGPTNTPLATLTPMPTFTPTPELPAPIRTELSATDPDQFLLVSNKVQLVEFFAYWCVTCRSMAPAIHSLEALYGRQVNFVYLDIDDLANEKYQQALGYRYQPHFFLLDEEGKILRQWIGWVITEELRDAIDAALR